MLSMILITAKTYCCVKGKHTQHLTTPGKKVLLAACGERHVATGTQSTQGGAGLGPAAAKSQLRSQTPQKACLYSSSADEAEPAQEAPRKPALFSEVSS